MWYNMNFVELRTPINMRIIIRQVGEFCSKAFFFFFYEFASSCKRFLHRTKAVLNYSVGWNEGEAECLDYCNCYTSDGKSIFLLRTQNCPTFPYNLLRSSKNKSSDGYEQKGKRLTLYERTVYINYWYNYNYCCCCWC
jgi:hypothetical protein